MDITTLTQLVGSLGFPIVCCLYYMVSMNRTLKENTNATNKMVELLTRMLHLDSHSEKSGDGD